MYDVSMKSSVMLIYVPLRPVTLHEYQYSKLFGILYNIMHVLLNSGLIYEDFLLKYSTKVYHEVEIHFKLLSYKTVFLSEIHLYMSIYDFE